MHWASPWFLLLLPAAAAGLIIGWRRKLPSLRLSTLASLPGGSRADSSGLWLRLPLLLEALGLACLIVALARPQRGAEGTMFRPKGIDIMIALDVSGSMEAVDVPNADKKSKRELTALLNSGKLRTRLEIAKDEIARFIAERPNDRIGLIAFTGHSFTDCPPTLDHDFLRERLASRTTGILGDTSTGIAPPIAAATSRLRDSQAKRRILLLLTDGENVREARITPLQAAQIAGKFKITIHTIGLGSKYGFVRHDSLFGFRWRQTNHFDPKLIKGIAGKTGGQWFQAEDKAGMAKVMREIDQLLPTTFAQPKYVEYKDLFPQWLAAGLLLLLLGFISEHTLFLKTP